MEQLRQKSSKDNVAIDLTKDLHKYTWDQAIAEIRTAQDAYQKDKGFVRSMFQKMCDNASTFESWLCLLPDGDYGATISGAFVMIVRGARVMSEVQRAIMETLASIPDALAHAKRGATAVFKGTGFEAQLMDSITDMRTQALELREEANFCLQRRIDAMDRKDDSRAAAGNIFHRSLQQVAKWLMDAEEVRHQLAKQELLLAIDSSTEITAQKVCTYLLRQLQANPDFSVRTGGLIQPFEVQLRLPEDEDAEAFCSETATRGNKALTAEGLLNLLDYDDAISRQDIETCLSRGYTQSDAAHTRSTWVFQSSELGNFLAGKTESRLLYINGNADATDFISPLSVVCARISDLVSVSDRVLLLSYFCGCHADELRDPRANPRGMLSSLLGQLIWHIKGRRDLERNLDLSSVTEQHGESARDEDLDALLWLFKTIVLQLPKGTVMFCLVDSLSVYENGGRREDMIKSMKSLARLVGKSKGVTLKVLVTFPGQGHYTDRWAAVAGSQAKMLHVPDDVL
ncbi:MAG: hypothetical protein Q9160_000420 [Pyrenula sp. 1 TL-2023]